MARFNRLQKTLFVLASVLVLASAITFLVPVVSCPYCLGTGKVTVMESHPEAMGSTRSSTGGLIDVGCPSCDGKPRMTLYQRLFWVPPTLASR